MEILKCTNNPIYANLNYAPYEMRDLSFRGRERGLMKEVGKSADKFVRGPVAESSATGLRGFNDGFKRVVGPIRRFAKSYVANIQHTYEHKIVYAMVEKELFGKNSLNSFTHDLDKLIMYALGFPKSFVSSFHRKHSSHHFESGKKPNLRSMVCDNVASSPIFKPEKKYSVREFYLKSAELQEIEGLGEMMESVNYGENLDFSKIKKEQISRYDGPIGFVDGMLKVFPILLTKII